MFDAKVAKIIRPLQLRKILSTFCPTSRSLNVKSGTSAFVESDNKHNTPSLPSSAIFAIFAGAPTGVKSNLKSPVWTILPSGVSTTTPYASGILCVVK